MNLEDAYMALYGASNDSRTSLGVKYEVIKKWFTECNIIDGRILTEALFLHSYERLCPNRERLSLAQFIQLLGILARETRQEVAGFLEKFQGVRAEIEAQVVEARRHHDYTLS